MSWTSTRRKLALGALVVVSRALAAATLLRPRRPVRYPAAETLVLPAADADRCLFLPGAVNLRDAGGYATSDGRRVRRGVLFRSGSLARLSPEAVPALAALGLKSVIDLRTPQEAQRAPGRLPDGAAYLLLPAYPDGNTAEWLRTLLFRRHELDVVMAEGYRRLADTRAAVFGEVLRRWADPACLPGLIHCTAGKDRTGLAVALALLAVGVPAETVIADYSLSNLAYDQVLAAAGDDVRRLAAVGLSAEEMRPLMTADPRNLAGLLDHLRARYGSVDAYLRDAAGVGPDVIARLRENLLEPEDPVASS